MSWFKLLNKRPNMLRIGILIACLLSLSACGFHLRQAQTQFVFNSLYLTSSHNSALTQMLKQRLSSRHIELTNERKQSDVTLQIVNEKNDKQILSLGGSGRVEEFNLHYRVIIRATDSAGKVLIEDEELQVRRDFSYSDSRILAKEAEEAFLQNNMTEDMVRQITQRLSRIRLTQ